MNARASVMSKKRKVISMSFMSIEKTCERMKRSALLWEGTSAM